MAGRVGSQGMVSIKVSKNVSCQALPSFRLLLKKAQHFVLISILFFFGFLLFIGSQICSSSGSVGIDMLKLPAGFNIRRSKRSGSELWCLLLRAAQTETVHHDQLWHLGNGDGHMCS